MREKSVNMKALQRRAETSKENTTGPVDIIRYPGYRCAPNQQDPELVSYVIE